MQVSPVDLNACGTCNYQSLINILNSDKPAVFGNNKGGATAKTHLSTNLIGTINKLNQDAYVPRDKITSDPVFVNLWLQYPNDIIRKMAMKIVHRLDSDDVKMEKIQRWVVDNIEYMTDEEQYGFSELWVPPVMLLITQKGDCEDGAFLIMSLGLNAGVDPANLRMFGGFVDAGQGAPSGSHGWVAYRRDSDNEWVALDYSYFPDLRPMGDRIPLKNDDKYVDDYFFITNKYIVVTENTNRIRDPEVYYSDGRVIPNILFPTGSLLSWYA
jgi:predicted transglutaminase-like cysteine proteinase